MIAIEAQLWNPVWEMIGKISDYNARDEVAGVIGAKCAETESVVTFRAHGSATGLRSGMTPCHLRGGSSEAGWSAPSRILQRSSTTRMDTLADVLVERKKVAASPPQRRCCESGRQQRALRHHPAHMADSVDAPFGQEPSPEDTQALQAALVEVAKQVDRAARAGGWPVADATLRSPGSKPAGHDYPDRVQDGGGFPRRCIG